MRLLVLGATGNTGLQVVSQALQRGHQVTALVRSPQKLPPRDGLTVLQGNVTNPADVAKALQGVDAVIGSVGPNDLKPTTIYEDSTRALLEALKTSTVKRLVLVTAATLFDERGLGFRLVRFILRHAVKDARVLESLVTPTAYEWTIVRPPRLTNGAARGTFRTEVGALPKGGGSIARADLAACLIDTVEQHNFIKQVVGVCY